MARAKKETVPSSFRLSADLAERLTRFCEDSGQSKTVAVERALAMYVVPREKPHTGAAARGQPRDSPVIER